MPRDNTPSILLSRNENDLIFNHLLADRVQSLSTAVVQLVTASQGPRRTWNLVVTGVACFVKDWNRKGFFIQVTQKKQLSLSWFARAAQQKNTCETKCHLYLGEQIFPRSLVAFEIALIGDDQLDILDDTVLSITYLRFETPNLNNDFMFKTWINWVYIFKSGCLKKM